MKLSCDVNGKRRPGADVRRAVLPVVVFNNYSLFGAINDQGTGKRFMRFVRNAALSILLNHLRAKANNPARLLHTLIQRAAALYGHRPASRCFHKDFRMLKVIAQDFIRPEAIDIVMPFYSELVEQTRKEPLCISYDLFVDHKDPGHFVFIEEWPDRAALDIHCKSEHFTRLVPLINAHQRAPATFILMDRFAGI